MSAREVEIDGGLFEVTMTEQHLHGGELSARFKQMRRKAMTQRVGMDVPVLQTGRSAVD